MLITIIIINGFSITKNTNMKTSHKNSEKLNRHDSVMAEVIMTKRSLTTILSNIC